MEFFSIAHIREIFCAIHNFIRSVRIIDTLIYTGV